MDIVPKYEDVVAKLDIAQRHLDRMIEHSDGMKCDLDAALGREAALREELWQCGSMANMIEGKEWAEHAGTGPVSSRVESAFTQLHNELSEAQQRLTFAEQRVGELENELRDALEWIESGDRIPYNMVRSIKAALKPAEEGEGS